MSRETIKRLAGLAGLVSLGGATLAGPVLLAGPGVTALSTLRAVPTGPGTGTSGAVDDLRLLGDWETPDAFLIGSQSLWRPEVDSLLAVLDATPVYVVSPADGLQESAWVRDYGPIQVERRGAVVWLDADYQAARPMDDALPASLGRDLGMPVERLPLHLDGGDIAADGRGLCTMTEAGLRDLAPLRSAQIARRFGCRELVVVPPLPGEPTGHVDLMIQFLAPDVVAVATLLGDGVSVADRARLDATAGRLVEAAGRIGRRLDVVRIPVYRTREGLFLSYVNVVALKHRLLVPDFRGAPAGVQEAAHSLLRQGSGKALVAIPADAMALVGGGLHCIVLGLHLEGPTASEISGGKRRSQPAAAGVAVTDRR